jgi:hypothetical protein
MTAAILGIVATVVAVLARVLYRKWQRDDDPVVQLQRAKDENAKAIAAADASTVNRLLDDGINSVPPNKGGGDTGGQDGDKA